MKKIRCKYCNKQITTHGNGNVQYYVQEENKLNIVIITSRSAHTITDGKIIKSPLNNNNGATFKANKILTKIVLVGPVE